MHLPEDVLLRVRSIPKMLPTALMSGCARQCELSLFRIEDVRTISKDRTKWLVLFVIYATLRSTFSI